MSNHDPDSISANGEPVPTIEQWNALSVRCGGDLFSNAAKLEAMRQVDRACGAKVPWAEFCDRVEHWMQTLDPNHEW